MKRVRLFVAAALALSGALPGPAATLRVFAAASLTESFQEIGKRYEATHPGVSVEFNFAGSPVLRTQIEQGAPADAFASADALQMKPLEEAGRVLKPVVFAHNSLVVVAPAARPRVRRLPDLAQPGIRIVLASENVPAGHYAEQVLKSISTGGQFGPAFERRVMSNVVSRETNVRSVLSKVLLGEADAGIVYVTDAATAKGQVTAVAIPTRYNADAFYPVAVVSDSKLKALAGEFITLVRSREGRRILVGHGFQPPRRHE